MEFLDKIIRISTHGPASLFMTLALYSFFILIVAIPVWIFSLNPKKRAFNISVTASLFPLFCGLTGFTICLIQMYKDFPDIPYQMRVAAYKDQMAVAFCSLWPSILTVLFLTLSGSAYRFISKKSNTDMQSKEQTILASRDTRLLGALVDGLIFILFLQPLLHSFVKSIYFQDISIFQRIILPSASILTFITINAYLIHKNGQTIAKRALGIKIVDYRSNTIANVFKIFFLRYGSLVLLSLVPVIGKFLGLINPLCIFGKEKRCLHDLIAGTKVVNIEKT
jgi:uncharacterized RDD family membrane protein YckC